MPHDRRVQIGVSAAPNGGVGGASFPDATNTGWEPTGVTLSTYPDSGTINLATPGAVIDGKRFNGDIVILAANIKITRSEVNGIVYSVADNGASSFVMEDCTINGGTNDRPAVGQENYTLRRCNVNGCQHNAQAWGPCRIENSWLHGGYIPMPGSSSNDAWHCNAFITNGGNGMTLVGNTLHASAAQNSVGGGPTADLSLFGDFGPVDNILVQGNLFKGTLGGYGVQAGYNPGKPYPTGTNIRFVDNVFERGASGKCGTFGPVTAWNGGATGNVWSGNAYQDGTPITP